MRLALGLIGIYLVVPAGALANPNYQDFEYDDWTVLVETRSGEQDTLITCTANASGTGIVAVTVEQVNLDAGPPDVYPSVYLTRILGEDHQPMALSDDDLTATWTFDGEDQIHTQLTQDQPEDGATRLVVEPAQTLALLQHMHAGQAVAIETPIFPESTVSLIGFTASYLKMAEQCDFSTIGVL